MNEDEISISFPVINLTNSREFYKKLGFKVASTDDTYFGIKFKDTMIMFYDEPTFKELFSNDISNTRQVKEILFSIGVESKEELYELATIVKNAGGILEREPAGSENEVIIVHSFRFFDLDGYLWGGEFYTHKYLTKASSQNNLIIKTGIR